MRQPCKKCLLAAMDLDEYAQNILEYIKNVPSDKRVAEDVYKSRLAVCQSCEQLSNGICAKCGCFVELRALKPLARCPDENKYW